MLIQLENHCSKPNPRSVFYSYSHKDEDLRDELDAHLKTLKRDGFISTWHDRKIPPGDEWGRVINQNLHRADVILFLVSHHFLASRYCRDVEVKCALERARKHEAILIPIILRPCAWTTEEFSRFQVLPKNCRPLVEWQDAGFAEVAEELRTMMTDLLYPQTPSEATGGQHGNWVVKLRNRPGIDARVKVGRIVERLREYTNDFTITLHATSNTQIAAEGKAQTGLMLILTGTPEAFAILDKSYREKKLADAIDEDLVSLYVIYGATIQGSSALGTSGDVANTEAGDLLMWPGKRVAPALFAGVYWPKGEAGELQFVFNKGDAEEDVQQKKKNYEQLLDYFKTALAIKNDFQWVNLSAYEADRMLPRELSGTQMGRSLLVQDVALKRITASFMHPDTQVGRDYWNAVYSEARRVYGTSKLSFRSFQKVWMTASKADIYFADDRDWSKDEVLGPMAPPAGFFGALLVDMALDVQCEEDILARKHNLSLPKGAGVHEASDGGQIALTMFKKIILPRIKDEVNNGEHFVEARRIYSAMILATWIKKQIHLTKHKGIRVLADSGSPKLRDIVMTTEIYPLGSRTKGARFSTAEDHVLHHSEPEASAFEIPENVEFFSQYIRLFKNGLFRCARSEAGDHQEERIVRVYFSGAINFRGLQDRIKSETTISRIAANGFAWCKRIPQ